MRRITPRDKYPSESFNFAEIQKQYPHLKRLTVSISGGPYGKTEERNGFSYGFDSEKHETLTRFQSCRQPLCVRGGFHIDHLIHKAIAEQIQNQATEGSASAGCSGSEGSPKGKKIYRECMNFATVRVQAYF